MAFADPWKMAVIVSRIVAPSVGMAVVWASRVPAPVPRIVGHFVETDVAQEARMPAIAPTIVPVNAEMVVAVQEKTRPTVPVNARAPVPAV